MDKHTFTNSAGETFGILPLNPLEEQILQQQVEAEWKAAGRALPEPPSYEAATVTGEVQKLHLASRADADTVELIAAWDAYEAAQASFQQAFSERFLTSCFLCVDADLDRYPRWRMRMKTLGVPLPEDEGERLILFCKTWVIRSKEDIPGLIFACTRTVANLSEEAMRAAEDMFRGAVEKAAAAIGSQPG